MGGIVSLSRSTVKRIGFEACRVLLLLKLGTRSQTGTRIHPASAAHNLPSHRCPQSTKRQRRSPPHGTIISGSIGSSSISISISTLTQPARDVATPSAHPPSNSTTLWFRIGCMNSSNGAGRVQKKLVVVTCQKMVGKNESFIKLHFCCFYLRKSPLGPGLAGCPLSRCPHTQPSQNMKKAASCSILHQHTNLD